MRLVSFLIAGLFLAHGAFGGSRLWEAKAPNHRAGIVPSYPQASHSLNATSHLVRRAVSIKHEPGNKGVPRIWPNKKIRYCFDKKDDTIESLWEKAMDSWSALREHGFSYEEVKGSICNTDRRNVLRIYYDPNGKLVSTLGIPTINDSDDIEGPYTYLSDKEGIGQDNIRANVGHELGHVWGLLHEHQVRDWWETSDEHLFDSTWPFKMDQPQGQSAKFQTSGFECQNLKDYPAALARAQAAAEKDPSGSGTDPVRLCKSLVVAQKHKFSAVEWLPMQSTSNYVVDDKFDPNSLMMYPSRAGGRGLGDDRLVVMRYADGSLIPNRLVPSDMDVQRLVTLYGSDNSDPPEEPHNSKNSGWRQKFRKMKSQVFRAGHTEGGLC